MKVPRRSQGCLDAACVLVVFVLGCSSKPATQTPTHPASRLPGLSVHVTSLPIGWTDSSPARQQNEPDSWSLDMPGIDETEPIEDPHGDDDSMIQRISVCGFGKVENTIAFLSVDDSSRTVQEGDTVLGFHVVDIENPFVTFEKAGRAWKLSTARKQVQKNSLYRNLIPPSPPVFGDHASPENMVLDFPDPAQDAIDPIDPMLEDSAENIQDPARSLEKSLEEPENP